MSVPPGVRDGEFIIFEGWDLPGNDVAHYQKYDKNIQALKGIMKKDEKSLFYAFNNRGWIKSLPYIDGSSFKKDSGYDTYVRVDYPGWLFVPGNDQPGNELYQIDDYNTLPSMTAEIDARTARNPENPDIAAFNTRGSVKYKIQYPLTDMRDSTSLDGIYIRTDFLGFNFFPRCDSSGNDVVDATDEARDIPSLISSCHNGETKGAFGFNTMGWIKNKVTIPPSNADYFNDDSQGIYVRTEWPDFVYLPGIVSPGNDITQLVGKSTAELIEAARKDSRVVAFNTNGWMKSNVASEPDFPSNPQEVLFGTYVKVPAESQLLAVDSSLIMDIALFILKGTVAIWGSWWLRDAPVRREYAKALSAACQEIKDYVAQGKLTLDEAVQKAFDMRQQYLVWAREKSSTLGQIFASSIKPADLRIDKYLNKYSQQLFGKDFAQVTRLEQTKVMAAVIDSAGRANPKVNIAAQRLGPVSKALLAASFAFSIVSIAIAPDWQEELLDQLSSWCRAFVLSNFPIETGNLLNPAGAILGGIAGTVVAAILDHNAFPDLIDWFWGGFSGRSASQILGDAYQPTLEAAIKVMKRAGRQYHIHRVYSSDLSAIDGDPSRTAEVAGAMVSRTSDAKQPGNDKLVATIVWTGSTDISATNPGNPGDLVKLIQQVQTGLPSYVSGVKVSYGETAPSDKIEEINKGEADINNGFGGEYVWLTTEWTDDLDKAATYFEVRITGSAQAGLDDLAKGAGGDYRYLIAQQDAHVEKKIRRLALYRKSNSEGPVTSSDIAGRGYTDFSTDINAGRGGDYLHLIWQAGF
ncbi:hypothetical protein F4802DRAFT_607591 [Xylaria palmicola]|nr:hypothetical protein F4802DRAFT_607591 [Xylaria palmicola]